MFEEEAKQTRYKLKGKLLSPLERKDFLNKMANPKGFKKISEHRPFVAFLYYFGVRVSEALKIQKSDIELTSSTFSVDIGERLKHSKRTPPLVVRTQSPYVKELITLTEKRKPYERLFPFSRITGWRIVRRAFEFYPHYFRLNRITELFEKGFTISQIRSWTGLSLQTLDYYIGIVDIRKMGKSM